MPYRPVQDGCGLWYAFIDKITNNDRQTAAFKSYIVARKKETGKEKMRKWRKCRIFILAFVYLIIYFRPVDIGKLFFSSCKRV